MSMTVFQVDQSFHVIKKIGAACRGVLKSPYVCKAIFYSFLVNFSVFF